jgi:hypothetical protein
MAVDKLDISGDARVTHKFATLNGYRYHYLHGVPQGPIKATIFLVCSRLLDL